MNPAWEAVVVPGLQERAFFNVASLLDPRSSVLFFDIGSTYWQTDSLPDELEDDDEDGGRRW